MHIPWEALVAAAGAAVTAIGAGARWVFDRFDKHQKAYLDSLKELADREEDRRKQHLDDTRFYARELRDLAHKLHVDVDSRRPPAHQERKP